MGRGSSKAGNSKGSISGEPFNPRDWKTWPVGTTLDFIWEDGQTSPGKVKSLHGSYALVDVPAYSDHLWLDGDTQHLFKNVKAPQSKKTSKKKK